jgi:hypothetical protein
LPRLPRDDSHDKDEPKGKYVRRSVYLRPRAIIMLDYLLAEHGKPKGFSVLIGRLIRDEYLRAMRRAEYRESKGRSPSDRT